jgi:hypothetical protein
MAFEKAIEKMAGEMTADEAEAFLDELDAMVDLKNARHREIHNLRVLCREAAAALGSFTKDHPVLTKLNEVAALLPKQSEAVSSDSEAVSS